MFHLTNDEAEEDLTQLRRSSTIKPNSYEKLGPVAREVLLVRRIGLIDDLLQCNGGHDLHKRRAEALKELKAMRPDILEPRVSNHDDEVYDLLLAAAERIGRAEDEQR